MLHALQMYIVHEQRSTRIWIVFFPLAGLFVDAITMPGFPEPSQRPDEAASPVVAPCPLTLQEPEHRLLERRLVGLGE